MEVRTDLSNFGSIIPDDECFISPVVKVLAPSKTETASYTLRIPHCLDEGDNRTKVRVRMVHENRNSAVVEVPKGNAGALYYDIIGRFIDLHTTHFCQVICTICQTPFHCRGRINSFWFASYDTEQQGAHVEIRPYFGGVLHSIVDFKQVFSKVIIIISRVVVVCVTNHSGRNKMYFLGKTKIINLTYGNHFTSTDLW